MSVPARARSISRTPVRTPPRRPSRINRTSLRRSRGPRRRRRRPTDDDPDRLIRVGTPPPPSIGGHDLRHVQGRHDDAWDRDGVNTARFASTKFTYARTITLSERLCDGRQHRRAHADQQELQQNGPGLAACQHSDGTIGSWRNESGQGLITGSGPSSGSSALATWLCGTRRPGSERHGDPLGGRELCDDVIQAASGSNMNAMLKAQMLGSTLNVYFSDPSLDDDKNSAPWAARRPRRGPDDLEGTSENSSATFSERQMMTPRTCWPTRPGSRTPAARRGTETSRRRRRSPRTRRDDQQGHRGLAITRISRPYRLRGCQCCRGANPPPGPSGLPPFG